MIRTNQEDFNRECGRWFREKNFNASKSRYRPEHFAKGRHRG